MSAQRDISPDIGRTYERPSETNLSQTVEQLRFSLQVAHDSYDDVCAEVERLREDLRLRTQERDSLRRWIDKEGEVKRDPPKRNAR